MYVTPYDFQKSFSLDMTVEITGKYAIWFVRKHTAVNMCYISQGIGVRKVLNS